MQFGGIDMIWQHLFQNHILERGFDYYNRQLVADLHISEDMIKKMCMEVKNMMFVLIW